MADEWRQCVDWLIECRILPVDHKAKQDDAQAFDLAQTLRDGVLLCHLLNSLKPYSVDSKDFSPRPQLSQFLCLKNIRAFLSACEKMFRIDSRDLFEPLDLFEVKNFRKVLHTLSKLSKTDIVQKKGIRGFPPNDQNDEVEEDIYGNLSNMAIDHGIEDNEELYDSVYQEGDDEIYEDIVSMKRKRRTTHPSGSSSRLSVPGEASMTKRDYCIKEMVDTERNYVDALKMIVNYFIQPLMASSLLSQTDKDIIFSSVERMEEVHSVFFHELEKACYSPGKTRLHEVFIKYKSKFLLYGDYCSNLPRAQEHIEELIKKNEQVRDKIEECERTANEGRFRLRDLLHVPMQRVLKYHLLLRELIKNTDRDSEDQFYLQQALESMQDLSLYVNEVKRDNEALALIEEIQRSIVDLQMPANTSLRDYGKLQKDGELKVRSHIDNRVRQRYIFLFDKVMLMAKTRIVNKLLWGDTYSFKEAIVLSEYKVDTSSAIRDGQRRPEKWNCTFQMVKQDNSMTYTLLSKTEEIKQKWIEAIHLALDNTQPTAGRDHIMTTFNEPKVCDICGKLLRGVFFQGYKNPKNGQCVHKECIGKTKQEAPPKPPKPEDKHKSTVRYSGAAAGQPLPGGGRRPLYFREGEIITVVKKDGDWWEGRKGGDLGWFPFQYVEALKGAHRPRPPYEEAKIQPSGRVTIPGAPGQGESPAHVHVDLNKYPWFAGRLDRSKAGQMLEHLPNSSFLVRESATGPRAGDPALSIKYNDTVRHIKIEHDKSNGYYLSDTRYFHTVPELIEYYQNHSLSDSFPEVTTGLKYPYKTVASSPTDVDELEDRVSALSFTQSAHNGNIAARTGPKQEQPVNGVRILSYAQAVYDYAATATSQISLKAGDRLAVLSKTGSDKGWWKGQHCSTGKLGYFPFAYVKEEEEE
ncbi:proto-oncogene vav-like isoform X2 [Mya arenaria]|uniref:proto-oncogene vav-like isoform X2 n=1 Tax=Mya arenaria TaxID=6604 RepID=UPI0022E748D5|nr:proto-oncogene vav-like isoform X2 [Mya arenaria]